MRWLLQTTVLHVLLAGLGLMWLVASGMHQESAWAMQQAEMSAAPAADIRSALALPEDAWRPLDQAELARWHGEYWLRFRLEAPESAQREAWLLTMSLRAASTVYWDGQFIGQNGQPAAERPQEVPGRIDSQFLLDRSLAGPGPHRVMIHASSHRASAMASAEAGIRVLSYPQARRYAWRWLVVALALGAIVSALAYWSIALRTTLATQTRDAGRPWLLALGMVGVLLPLAESWRPLFGYDYDWHALRLSLILALHAATALLLPGYLIARFIAAPHRWFATLGIAWLALSSLVLAPAGFDARSWLVQFGGLVLALTIASLQWRTLEVRPLCALLLSSIFVALAWPADFLDGLYFIALALVMVYLMLDDAAHARRLGELHERLSAERDRLRLQLLHRAIQPHWLMNSLTSLQELIEQAPAHASRLVELLAEHFSLLRAHSERDQVSLSEEIALCRVQLDIAGLAQQGCVAFRVEGDVSGIDLPPGVLHCLVENALTHAGFRACAEQGFTLRVDRNAGRVHLELRAPLAPTRSTSLADGGTGTQYVRASLARRSPQGASFAHGARADYWCSTMEWPCVS
ncbi:MAG: histidine kinase [Rhodanobacteraceae bacterium]|nr:histidine kinase [Rhodanobacteraceae bacterium]